MGETIAERLRDAENAMYCMGDASERVLGERLPCRICTNCAREFCIRLAEAIEEEQSVNASNPMPLDADGQPCFLGDAVWSKGRKHLVVAVSRKGKACIRDWETRDSGEGAVWVKANQVTHRKPDTFESVVTEMLADFDSHDTIELDGYFDRLRRLIGGE